MAFEAQTMVKKKHRTKVLRPRRNAANIVICRCEEVTETDVTDAIRAGYHSLQELKRILRVGMGHCQGRGCLRTIARLIEQEVGVPASGQEYPSSRPPLKPLMLGVLSSFHYDKNR